MNLFHFTESDLAISVLALRSMSVFLANSTPDHHAHVVKYAKLADRITQQPSSLPVNDLRYICIALKFFIEDNPTDFMARDLFSRLSAACGFIDIVT